jgi:hypothetical protein
VLIGNFNVLSKHPGRDIGGGATGLGYQLGQMQKAGRGRFTGETWEPKSGVPDGYRPPYCWIIPIKDGALSARNNLVGEGTFAGAVSGGKNAEAAITGTGTLTGTGQLIISMLASLSGTGAVSSASLQAFLQLAAALSGTGSLAAVATGNGNILAALNGAGDADATATAKGTLAAAITVTGDLLTTANIADAILDDANAVETGLTVRNALRLMAAALAGELSGGATTTITIKNAVAGDKDRIEATVDANGNRSSVTVDLTD